MKIERGDIMTMYGRSALIVWTGSRNRFFGSRLGAEVWKRFNGNLLLGYWQHNGDYAEYLLAITRKEGQSFASLQTCVLHGTYPGVVFTLSVCKLFEWMLREQAPLNPTGFRIDIEIPDEIWGKCLPILAFLPDCVHVWKYEKEDQLKLIDIS